jgi:hypothetical protein
MYYYVFKWAGTSPEDEGRFSGVEKAKDLDDACAKAKQWLTTINDAKVEIVQSEDEWPEEYV